LAAIVSLTRGVYNLRRLQGSNPLRLRLERLRGQARRILAAVGIFAFVIARLVAGGKGRAALVLGVLLIYWPTFHLVLPEREALWLGWKAAQAVRGSAAQMGISEPIVAAAGSRVLCSCLDPRRSSPTAGGPPITSSDTTPGSRLSTAASARHFTRLGAAGITAQPLGEVHGINYSTGQRQALGVYARE
jgi:hypothetical protein